MNVLILVMSARRDPWNMLMDTQLSTWDAEDHPQTRTMYYCGKRPGVPSAHVYPAVYEPNGRITFYSPELGEELEEISPRTIEAFEESLEFPDWDYMARVHASTYVHKGNLVRFCCKLPVADRDHPWGHPAVYGLLTEGPSPFIWGGGHYIFSRAAIFELVSHKDKWNTQVMEDVSITQLVNELGIPVMKGHTATINLMQDGTYTCDCYGHGENFVFRNFDEFRDQEHFFYRCKQDLRRHEDVKIMRELKRCLK